MIQKNKAVLGIAVIFILATTFFCGYTLGHSDIGKDTQLRVATAETTTRNCLNKIAGWCDNKRFRLVDCGDDLHACVCISQTEVQTLQQKPEEE